MSETKHEQKRTMTSMEIQQTSTPLIDQEQYSEEPYRYFNTILFCLSGLADSFIGQSLSAISQQVQQYCDASQLKVDMCAMVFMIVHPFMTFAANYVLNRWGLKIGISINCILMIVGLGLRCLVRVDFNYVLAGNTVIAIGNVFILNSPSQYSATWFKPERRLLVTSIAVFCMIVSGGIGALISPFIVRENLSQEAGLDSVFRLMVVQGAPLSAIMFLNLFLFRGQPHRPPAPSGNTTREEFLPSLKGLMRNRNYILLFFAMTCVLGTSNSFAVTIEDFLSPFDISSIQTGIGLALTVLMGLIGSVLSSLYSTFMLTNLVRSTRKYTFTIKAEMIIGVLAMAALAFPLLGHVMIVFWVLVCVLGFFIYPVIPGLIELGSQVVFPIGESMSTGFLLAGGQLFGFILGVAQTNIIRGQSKMQSIIGGVIYTGVFALSLVIFFFVKQDLRRLSFQSKALENEQTEVDSRADPT